MAFIVRSLALLVALLVLAGQPAIVSAAERSWSERQAGPLTIRYVGDDQAEFNWYADAAEQAYRDVQDIFSVALRESNVPPRTGIVITLYGDDAAYGEANPVAAREEGILGQANPTSGEIGIGVARLRDKSEATRRDSMRHELTHLVLGDLSNQRLPIGFQEGIAQYVERDTEQRQRFATTIRQGMGAGQLLHFADLNRSRPFLARAGLAYPESYSMVVYLAGRYGFGQVIHLVEATRDAATLDDAASTVLGRSMADLEQEWLAFLPSFLDQDWPRNDLDLWDLAIPHQQLAAGQYAAAHESLKRAERLFTSVGRDDRAAEARADLDRAQSGIEATDLTRDGTAALSVYDYDSAATLLGQAEQRWLDVGDAQRSTLAGETAAQARDGQAAAAQLDDARRQLEGWHFQEADEQAFAAGQALSDLGDAPRTEEARQVMADAQRLRTRLGLAAVGSGAVGVTGLSVAWLFGRRRRTPSPPARSTPLTPQPPLPHAGEGEPSRLAPLSCSAGEGASRGPRQDWSL
jgi:peptidase MA superfamily protein